jgi:hypothetical protein
MILRSGRKVFNDSVEGYEFLNTYSSISYIKERKVFRHHLKILIKKWYLWLVKKHVKSNYVLSPWLLFGLSIYNKWVGLGNESMYLTSNESLIISSSILNCLDDDSELIG